MCAATNQNLLGSGFRAGVVPEAPAQADDDRQVLLVHCLFDTLFEVLLSITVASPSQVLHQTSAGTPCRVAIKFEFYV